MDVLIHLVIWVHIIAFVAGGSNSVAGPIIGARLHGASPEQRAAYFGVLTQMASVGKIAMVTLLVTGPLALWLKFGGLGGVGIWFWVKMALIVVMLVSIGMGDASEKKAQAGDHAAESRAAMAHKVTAVAFAGVILAAVLAFN
ncbi:hypothetical protein PSQ90_13975 [Devosia rhodophyticola]|uniref:DUF2269 family protein n=1 Tax=Devosia rhodophyticola TaxID=3026423 RepID=A0ABY7YWS8_9HYPH|nr:hypothetical protein [Devosia rhodophyticola]WDR05379.1 hypothetical protein PSQ90_13975 [Devosia rhodophyticola]